ncbi:XRE family transcriptional regulator [Bombilactobacillus bombi]|uniref:XRE family transcriptional regulator n=1 Tax=Bombilactobacillus bombi TaxID=1303590 RepID=A0A417Z698_9LACO|nr:helix-turn-helix transcriptional regulator [Bombilactobacillus bombi]RHW46122.1 XRE family transcriptional regulator [Bombilactobacillus bombi]
MTTLDRIKKLAKQRGWSLQKLAEKAELGKNSIYRWNTKVPSTASLQKVANVLNVSIEDLLDSNDLPKKPAVKDITEEINNPDEDTLLAYEGMPIPEEELEMIRRILEGRKRNG